MNTKNLFRSLFLFLISFVSVSCVMNIDGVMGKGTIIAEHVSVSKFNAIESASSADVEITKGDSLQVILSDYENLLEYWDIKVINNTLIIQTKPFSSLVNTRAKVTIVMPDELYEARVAGSGDIALNSQFSNLEKATIMGSGSFNGNANTVYSNLNLTISGSGNINLKGSANELITRTLGSGKMRLSELTVQHVDCTISGSGDVYLDVENTLKARILGSGDIYYSGRPIIDIYGAGSGKLIHN